MTEVNHDPGPRTTQSALRIAATDSGQAGGVAGTSRTVDRARGDRHLGLAEHHLHGRRVSRVQPAHVCLDRQWTAAIGSTRPWAWRSRPTRSSPATGSSCSSQSATMRRLPRACPPSGPSPANRC